MNREEVVLPPAVNYLLYGLWLLACALPAALAARAGVLALGLDGVPAAIAMVMVAMVLAVLFFALSVVVGRALRLIH
jgi:ABC-type uncharacterized transport system permease subunit